MGKMIPSQVAGVVRYTFVQPAPPDDGPWEMRGFNKWNPDGFRMRVETATCDVVFTPVGSRPKLEARMGVRGRRVLASGELSQAARGWGENTVFDMLGLNVTWLGEDQAPGWVERFGRQAVQQVVSELHGALARTGVGALRQSPVGRTAR